MEVSQPLEIKQPKKPRSYFILELVLVAIVLIVAYSADREARFGPSERALTEQRNQENSAAAERYTILSERFKDPQKVISVSDFTLVFENNLHVTLMYTEEKINDQTSRQEFEKYANENLVGKEVMLELPPKIYFINHYCCYEKGDEEHLAADIWEQTHDRDHTRAFVYFNGEMLNEKFGVFIPNSPRLKDLYGPGY